MLLCQNRFQMDKPTLGAIKTKSLEVSRANFLNFVHTYLSADISRISVHASPTMNSTEKLDVLIHFMLTVFACGIMHKILKYFLRIMVESAFLSAFVTETSFVIWTEFGIGLDTTISVGALG